MMEVEDPLIYNHVMKTLGNYHDKHGDEGVGSYLIAAATNNLDTGAEIWRARGNNNFEHRMKTWASWSAIVPPPDAIKSMTRTVFFFNDDYCGSIARYVFKKACALTGTEVPYDELNFSFASVKDEAKKARFEHHHEYLMI